MILRVSFVASVFFNFAMNAQDQGAGVNELPISFPDVASRACVLDRQSISFIDTVAFEQFRCEIISEIEFPKAIAFLESIVQKYPQAFLNVKMVMSRMPCPQASVSVIHIPYNWLLELEAEIPKVQKWIEWALLHEAGHIKRKHVLKNFVTQNLMHLAGLSGMAYFGGKFLVTRNTGDGQSFWDVYVAYFSAIILFPILYSRFVMEPQADDFAVQTCDNAQALEAGALFLDKCSLDNIMYPTVQSRIDKIHAALSKRFGKNI